VIRCRKAGRPAVLKVSPARKRVLDEAAALARWKTVHVPAVLAVDERVGALLIEAIEPGTPLDVSTGYPSLETVAGLIRSLHDEGEPDPAYETVAERSEYFFESGRKDYERGTNLEAVIPLELYERGRQHALRLAADLPATVLLHGDLTPVNILDGGAERGLVAIDPAPCLGDPACDAVDLVLWRAPDLQTITMRAQQLAPAIGADADRLLDWCAAFAAMVALETAAGSSSSSRQPIEPYLALAELRT
jgi:streptomycin 6-kinase